MEINDFYNYFIKKLLFCLCFKEIVYNFVAGRVIDIYLSWVGILLLYSGFGLDMKECILR
jgi:hypothetical protein